MALQPSVLSWQLFFFFFLNFVILFTKGIKTWTWDKPIAMPIPKHRTAHTQNKRTQKSMPFVRFEPTTPGFEQANTVHTVDRAASVMGKVNASNDWIKWYGQVSTINQSQRSFEYETKRQMPKQTRNHNENMRSGKLSQETDEEFWEDRDRAKVWLLDGPHEVESSEEEEGITSESTAGCDGQFRDTSALLQRKSVLEAGAPQVSTSISHACSGEG
jgi:hypothetical protein